MSTSSLVAIRDAWSQYVELNCLDVPNVRSEVANSWRRCRNLNVDPYRQVEGSIGKLELKERLYHKQRLIRIARPFMENLYDFVKGTGFQVVLTDENGYLLEVLGDADIVDRTRHIHLCPGGDWSESVRGTNAIGTAIFERKPVQIHASEHYCLPHHFLTCSGAPIYDPEGQMVGTLDMSGDHRLANAHTLGMVVAAVGAIQNQLRLQKVTEKLYVAYRYSNILLESMSDGLISIDNQGIITEMNPKGGQIFGLDPVVTKGRNVGQVFSSRPPVLRMLSDGVAYEDREIVINKLGKKIKSSASLLRDDKGQVIGAVAVFREVGLREPLKRPSPPANRYTFDDIIGDSPVIAGLKEWAKQAAEAPSTVLIHGESGTGKELFAQAIHNASFRREQPFVAINCAALPENLIESELFGYEEGAFTGAKRGGQAGKFEAANGGTLFLDEIGDMPLSVQTKLLRVIQEMKLARLGSTSEFQVDIRLIVATHKDLSDEVKQGRFRQDLFYRLHVLDIRIPSLRERMEDVPVLARHLAGKIATRLKRKVVVIEDEFFSRLQAHSWPGNVRELENAIERAMVSAGKDDVLRAAHLELPTDVRPRTESASVELKSFRETESDMIRQAISMFKGNIQKASGKLGVSRNTLYRKMKECGLS
jgi:sigma-54 dependent transcriptional regulator, acetoin dehydrogenase operon transcriptional activator AcoR